VVPVAGKKSMFETSEKGGESGGKNDFPPREKGCSGWAAAWGSFLYVDAGKRGESQPRGFERERKRVDCFRTA